MPLLRLQQYNSTKPSFHHRLAEAAFDFFFHIRVFQGLITQSKISGFIVVIESSKVVSIIISQQGINRNKKRKSIKGKFAGLFFSDS